MLLLVLLLFHLHLHLSLTLEQTGTVAAAAVRLEHVRRGGGRHGQRLGRLRLRLIVWHFIRVPFDVRLHLLLVLERLVADRALVALGPVMLHPMQFQHVVVAKVPEADVAVVRLFARMRPRVHLQLFRAREPLAAAVDGTFVRFFACIRENKI